MNDDNFRSVSSEKQLLKQLKDTKVNLHRREVNVDSVLFDSIFSNADGLYEQNIQEFKFEEFKKTQEVSYIINSMLPEIEKEVIYLLFFLNKNQETTGRILKISQEMVYYYKKRALSRIKIHYFLRSVDIQQMETFLDKYVTKKQKLAMLEYFKEHDLRNIAKKITIIENKKKLIPYEAIGSRIKLGIKTIESLKDMVEDVETKKNANFYFEVFTILKSYNSLHHTQSKKSLPQEIVG
jgi:hypothetical protein